ncbi:alpha/beta fold hydrolase [Cellulomonas rhizosphaerae]|uniref:Alpha/beta hydrolase n=1 Tax=Cellulomonas rhizosphaerae TaxID=2293719 RepID=A0A413RNB7_9CELL|nr:alpha/beta hydrolase [Cellulomonas rhizosphaerae]RHA43087.1 alpha/beta hydrolase [Cellulomonas rhizosphaerae]
MSTVDSATLLIDGPWQHRFVAANGARFHAAVAGPDDRDAPLVVLLHGVPQFWWAWRHQIPVLADAGYRVAALDVRGTGGSDKPPQGYDVPTLTNDVAGVIRSLGSSAAVVVGSGTGGEIAWAMGALQPDVTLAVGALAAPHPLDVRANPVASLRPRGLRRLAYVQTPSVPERAMVTGDLVDRLLTEWGGSASWCDPSARATYRDAARVPFAAHSQLEQLRWLLRSTPRLDGRRYAAGLEQATPRPALQVQGGRDGLRPAARAPLTSQTAARVASTYRYELLPTAGHFPAEQEPGRVNDLLLDWLTVVAPVAP